MLSYKLRNGPDNAQTAGGLAYGVAQNMRTASESVRTVTMGPMAVVILSSLSPLPGR